MSKLITDRFSIIKKYIKNKEVLDIGCIDHYSEREIKNLWIHKKIKTYAKSLIGVDLIKKEVDKLNNKGYDIICDNAETFNLNKKFDIIFAGELIEHINNQGLFLENVRKHLKDDGKFIFTTPNCNNFFNTIEVLLFGQTPVNDEHVLWHNYATLFQLLDRFHFKIDKHYYVVSNDSHFYEGFKKVIIFFRFILHIFITKIRKDYSSNHLMIASIRLEGLK